MNEREIFDAALALPDPAQRSAYLDRACADDLALKKHLESLLEMHQHLGSFLEGAAVVPAATTERANEGPGAVIGPYRLLQEIGEGGMGTVFMAQQTEPVQRLVALKLIKVGMDSKQVIARFEAERQALALMDHPSIARVLDAGTVGVPASAGSSPEEDRLKPGLQPGRPYFVMELVQGVPITTFCDMRQLTPRQRLELFVPVCAAVQHAHQKGVIHRDLKPSNVLVALYDGKPVPKVIDFGIAKATRGPLTEKTLVTGLGAIVGTLEYMSPEQAELDQLDIDTRSDIYALGVLLYELLTGTTPLERRRVKEAALLEVLRLIREEEPPRPSTRLCTMEEVPGIAAKRGLEPKELSGLVRGELDWIVMKALEKDRNRRYDSANGFAADVQRYLADEPVQACPPSARYRLRKFVRRNKGPVVAALLVLVALLGGMSGTAWQAVRAERERALAAQERDDKQDALVRLGQAQQKTQAALAAERQALRQALAALRTLTDDVIERQRARQVTLTEEDRAFLNKIVAHYEALAAERGDGENSRFIRAEGYLRIGTLRYRLGGPAEALGAYERGRELSRQLAADFPTVPAYRQVLAGTHNDLGVLLRELGKHPQAEAESRQGLALYRQLATDFPTVPEYRNGLASSHLNLGHHHADLGNRLEAAAEYRQALALLKQLADDFPTVPVYRQDLAGSHTNLGSVLGNPPEAEAEFRQALALNKQLADDFPTVPAYRQGLAGSHNNLGALLARVGRYSEAEAQSRQALALRKQLAADFPIVPAYREELAANLTDLGASLAEVGKYSEAEAQYRQALALQKQLAADFPTVPAYRQDLARSHGARGTLLGDLGKQPQAEAEFRQALALQKQLAADLPAVPAYRQELAKSHGNLGTLLRGLGKRPQAEAEYRQALALLKQLADDFPTVPAYRQDLALSHNNLGALLDRVGKYSEAEAQYRQALALQKQLAADFPTVLRNAIDLGGSFCNLANLVLDGGKPVDALDWYRQAIQTLAPVVEREPRLRQARKYLRNGYCGQAEALSQLQRFAEAIKDLDQALALDDGTGRASLRMLRARYLARLEPARAVAEAEELLLGETATLPLLYSAACVCSLASAQGQDTAERDRHAARAVALLRQICDRGYFQAPAGVENLKKDPDLDALRQREDFQKLLVEVGKKKD